MTKEELIKKNKPALQSICTDLSIQFEEEEVKRTLAEKIIACPEWVNHPDFSSPETDQDTDTTTGNETSEESTKDAEESQSDTPDATADDIKLAELQKKCVDNEIAMNGDETIEQLEALIQAKIDSLKGELQEECDERGIKTTGNETSEELNALIVKDEEKKILIIEKKAAISELVNSPINAPEILAFITDQRAKAGDFEKFPDGAIDKLKAAIEVKGVTNDYLQQTASHLIDCLNQMIKQLSENGHDTDRYYIAAREITRMRDNSFIH